VKGTVRFLLVTTLSLFVFGCATSVPIQVTRPAELDLGKAGSISVLPFGLSSEDNARNMTLSEIILARWLGVLGRVDKNEAAIAKEIEVGITSGLLEAEFMDVVPSSRVQTFLENPRGDPPVDVYLTGEITSFSNEVSIREGRRVVNKVETTVTEYTRSVQMEVLYQVIDARTNAVVAYKTKDFNRSTLPQVDPDRVDSAESVMSSEIERFVQQILRELQPYEVTRYLTLAADETKDPAMEAADRLVKDGFIQRAVEEYGAIYARKNNFAAGYNEALLMQALGDLEGSLVKMKALADAFADRRALAAARDIEQEIASAERLSEQTSQ
jgi:hypothetical protein